MIKEHYCSEILHCKNSKFKLPEANELFPSMKRWLSKQDQLNLNYLLPWYFYHVSRVENTETPTPYM